MTLFTVCARCTIARLGRADAGWFFDFDFTWYLKGLIALLSLTIMNVTEPVNIRERIARCSERKTPGERQDCINQIIVESVEALDRRAEETGSDTKLILASMSAFQNSLRDEMRNFRESMDNKLTHLENKMDDRFNKVDERFNKVDERFNKVDERLNKVDERFNKVDERFNKVDERLNGIEKRVGLNDVDIAQIKSWVGSIFDRVNSMDPKISALEALFKEHFSRKAPEEMHG
jgi:chromosome segregation ATPase